MLENFSWFLLVPVWVSVLIMGARFLGIGFSKKNTVILSVISTIFSALYCGYGLYYTTNNSPFETSFSFIKINSLSFNLGVYVDMLSSLIGLTVSIITLIIYIYSVFYMQGTKSFARFYSLMNLFNTTILAFIFSPNLFQMLLFWECIGAVSYLLIGFDYKKTQVSSDAKRVFLINILGDMCLFAGFVISSNIVTDITQNIELASLPFSELGLIASALVASTLPKGFTIITLLFVMAAVVKSAQFPVNSWIINAMSAPTPVSALIHSSTLVMTGAFLLMRIFPIVALDNISINVVIYLGLITALITSVSALVQSHIKKVLAYSTSAQLGLVFLSIGCYNPVAAVVFLVSHAVIKSLLFMCAGIVIKCSDSKNIIFMGEIRKYSPVTALCFIVGAIALSGIGFCGFNAKYLVASSFCTNVQSSIIFGFIGLLTTLYIFRLYFLVFENKSTTEYFTQKLKYPYYALSSIIFMALFVIIGSFFIPQGRLCLLYILNLLVIIVSYFIYSKQIIKIPSNKLLHNIIQNGFFINKVYSTAETVCYRYFCRLISFFDNYIIGGFEWMLKILLTYLSGVEGRMQTNNFQTYISYGIWIILLISAIFTILYMYILNFFGV